MALQLRDVFARHGIALAYDSPTNQQFVILTAELCKELSKEIAFEVWGHKGPDELICRFVTSWATTQEDIDQLDRALSSK